MWTFYVSFYQDKFEIETFWHMNNINVYALIWIFYLAENPLEKMLYNIDFTVIMRWDWFEKIQNNVKFA